MERIWLTHELLSKGSKKQQNYTEGYYTDFLNRENFEYDLQNIAHNRPINNKVVLYIHVILSLSVGLYIAIGIKLV